jgi:serine/threonine protein kinase
LQYHEAHVLILFCVPLTTLANLNPLHANHSYRISGHEFTKAGDVWAVGIIMIEFLTRKKPFYQLSDYVLNLNLYNAHASNPDMKLPESCPRTLVSWDII